MKPSTMHSLMTAKAILSESKPLISAGNAHTCSAGLILLQDALELVVLALLGEIGADEDKSLESKSFDELLGELKKAGVTLPKLGTIKALNKQRVITKHYGQLAEPATVRNYYACASLFIEATLKQVIGKELSEVVLTDLLPDCEAKYLLRNAVVLKEQGRFLECLIEVRKALYAEYEHEYAIHRWADVDANDKPLGLAALGRGGLKAPYWKRNHKWISENVRKPSDFIQIDHEALRLDAMEWGVSTAEVENLRRLTPMVFRYDKKSEWCVEYDLRYPANEATLGNCNECIGVAVSMLLKKKEHERIRRWPDYQQPHEAPTVYIGHPVFRSASKTSENVHTIREGYLYTLHSVVSGFNPGEYYYYISGNEPPDDEHQYGKNHVWGYLQKVE